MAISVSDSYRQNLLTKLNQALSQKDEISQAAKWIAQSMLKQGWLYIFGTGHSHLLAEEIFYRAGGFARVRPIFDPRLMLHQNASQSTEIERAEGMALDLLGEYQLTANDVVILVSNSGRNAAPIDMALEAKNAGSKTICLTNLRHSHDVKSRHSSGKKLYEICDLTLDNFGEIGDASTTIQGLNTKMGATSTIIGSAILNALILEAATILAMSGSTPEVFHSSNTDSGEQKNDALLKKYKPQIRGL